MNPPPTHGPRTQWRAAAGAGGATAARSPARADGGGAKPSSGASGVFGARVEAPLPRRLLQACIVLAVLAHAGLVWSVLGAADLPAPSRTLALRADAPPSVSGHAGAPAP